MRDFSALYKLPNKPAVYALYSGGKGPQYVAYDGNNDKLKLEHWSFDNGVQHEFMES